MLGINITVNFDTYILTPVAVVNKEPKTSVVVTSPVAKFMTEFQKTIMNSIFLDLLGSKEIGK